MARVVGELSRVVLSRVLTCQRGYTTRVIYYSVSRVVKGADLSKGVQQRKDWASAAGLYEAALSLLTVTSCVRRGKLSQQPMRHVKDLLAHAAAPQAFAADAVQGEEGPGLPGGGMGQDKGMGGMGQDCSDARRIPSVAANPCGLPNASVTPNASQSVTLCGAAGHGLHVATGLVGQGERECGGTGLIGGAREPSDSEHQDHDGQASTKRERDTAVSVEAAVSGDAGEDDSSILADDDLSHDPWDDLLNKKHEDVERHDRRLTLNRHDRRHDMRRHDIASPEISTKHPLLSSERGVVGAKDGSVRDARGVRGVRDAACVRDAGDTACKPLDTHGVDECGVDESEANEPNRRLEETDELLGQLYANLALSCLKLGQPQKALEMTSKVLFVSFRLRFR